MRQSWQITNQVKLNYIILEKNIFVKQEKTNKNAKKFIWQTNWLRQFSYTNAGFPTYYDVSAGNGHVEGTYPDTIGSFYLQTVYAWT